ncbi:competence protein ComF [Zobellella denitrificans]|uniref:Competence protein ComF n=1 Tax=Zobellella denitrificans TaxID=347534 RepID=A0A291HTI1_9GAMM|nr:ComF family protein [Zobellella denitrificans]ATG75546.1 competence protein ComF [Zobellella denitrificans]
MIRRLTARLQSGPLWWGQCLLCRQNCTGQPLICRQCRDELPRLERPCPLCAFPLAVEDAHCGRCQRRPPPWQRLRVLADFVPPYTRLVHDLKYQHRALNGRLLGQLLAEAVEPPWPEAILPVPLHWWRQLRRGYNQAGEIARGLADRLAIPVDNRVLRRVRATAAQTHLNRRQRRRNLRGAFALGAMNYRHVALLDDVITTGATMAELTRLLHTAGVERVEVWAPCRTLEH